MRSLLDVNVLLALFDPDHVDHRNAQRFAATDLQDGWATCPLTQNGFVRIISQPRYPSPVPTADALSRLAEAASSETHAFWPDDISLLDPSALDRSALLGPRHLTDAYLLALAVRHGGRLVTFDTAYPLAPRWEPRPSTCTSCPGADQPPSDMPGSRRGGHANLTRWPT